MVAGQIKSGSIYCLHQIFFNLQLIFKSKLTLKQLFFS